MSMSKLSTQSKGKIAELKVETELIARGFQTYRPSNDIGVDILTLNDNLEPCFLQVKYSRYFPKFKCYWQNIYLKSFNRMLSDNTFCIFLLENNYLIVPYAFIQKRCKVQKRERYIFQFKVMNNKVLDTRNKVDFSEFLNNWDILKNKNEKSSL